MFLLMVETTKSVEEMGTTKFREMVAMIRSPVTQVMTYCTVEVIMTAYLAEMEMIPFTVVMVTMIQRRFRKRYFHMWEWK